jgi:hypothetical protein
MKNKIHPSIPARVANGCMALLAAGLCPHLIAAELNFSLVADADHSELGSGFAAVGDLNADGVVDVAVADRSARVGTYFGSGIVHIVSGADGSLLRTYQGDPAASQYFGSSLVALNADGDGIPDLAVGSPGQAGASGFGAGAVRIYAGVDGSLLSIIGGPDGSQLGAALANAGDQNGDGLDDLYVGAPNANGSWGGVFVLSGSDGATLREITTDVAASSFGVTLVTLGDVDGDGRADLAVGAPGFRALDGNPVGRVVLVCSSDSSIASEMTGSGSVFYNRLGESLASAADANGDDLPDLLVGSYSGGTARLVSGADFVTLVDLSIPTLRAWQPLTVGGSLDFDADGTADWLIGSPGLQTVNSQSVGAIRVISGADQTLLFEFVASVPYSGLGLSIQDLPGLGFAAGEMNLQDPVTRGFGLAHVWAVEQVQPILDSDGDGVLDDIDVVPQSIMDATVILLGIDSGVTNRVNEEGITLADRFAALGDLSDYRCPALYHAKAVQLSVQLVHQHLINGREALRLSAAALQGFLRATRRH